MNQKKILTIIVLSLCLVSGIGRHDVNKDKNQKLAQQKQFDCVGKVYVDKELAGHDLNALRPRR